MSFFDLLILIAPEAIVLAAALVVLVVDMAEMRHKRTRLRRLVAALLSTVGCLLALYWLGQADQGQRNSYSEGLLVVDPLVLLMKQVILLLTVLTAWISVESDFTDHVGEYFMMVLLAALGMMFLVSSENLLMIFVSLELVSLSLYIMTAFNKRNPKSAEAGLKYFLFGGMSAAFLLFGLSWLYGATGELNLPKMAVKLAGNQLDPLVIVAILMVTIGLGFKIAAVPFHLWAPDAYQGAPAPTAAFIASGSKVASFFILAKVMMAGFKGAEGSGAWHHFAQGWVPLLAILAALSMVVGNLAALVQGSVRRLLAYSAVAHAGYMLLGLLPNAQVGVAPLLYYVTTYALTTLGAFGVVAIVQEQHGEEQLATFAGLSRRAPLLSFCMMIFMLSLAGIPPLAGFFGKLYVFVAAAGSAKNLGMLWLVILAIAMNAVALYYYLIVLKQIYVADPPADAPAIAPNLLTKLTVALLAVAVVALGCLPNLWLEKLQAVVRFMGM